MSPKETCTICKKPLPAEAMKCTECGSYQDWSHHFLKYAGVGAAVLGLVPFFTIAASLGKIAFQSPKAEIQAALLACSKREAEIALANSGDIPAILTSYAFEGQDAAATEQSASAAAPEPTLRRKGESSEAVVLKPAGDVEVLRLGLYSGGLPHSFPDPDTSGQPCAYVFRLTFTDFSKAETTRTLTCPCISS